MVIVLRKRDRAARRKVAAQANHAGADLQGRRLVGMDLRRKCFREANLRRADLTEADLESADLRGANLRSAYLTGAQLVGADLSGACLDGAYLIATNFRHAKLNDATFDHAIWDQATTWPDGRQDARGPNRSAQPSGQSVAVDAPSTPKDVVRRFLDHGWTDAGWDMDVILECFSETYWSHTWQGDLASTGARQGAFFSALELVERLSDDLLEDGAFVVHRSTLKLRHVGELFGLAPTRRVVTCEHVEMWRVAEGQIVEHWGGLGAGGQLYRALSVDGPADRGSS